MCPSSLSSALSVGGRDALRSLTRLSNPNETELVVVVGLPRSGSTFLSHILGCLDDLFVFGDLYCVQRAQILRCSGPLTSKQLDAYVDFLGQRTQVAIRHRIMFEPLPMTFDEVQMLCATVREVFRDVEVTWPEVVDEFFTRLARFHGRKRWGYKTPQDLHHIQLLRTMFPRVKFILLMRDPRHVMASFKFNRGEDGYAGQYHPLVYIFYWKMAITTVTGACSRLSAPLCVMRFEDMVNSPESMADRLGEFLNTSLVRPISTARPNTSFASSDRKSINSTELWLCQKIAGRLMAQNGYVEIPARPRLRDLFDLLATSLGFLKYQAVRLLRERGSRIRVGEFCKRLLFPWKS